MGTGAEKLKISSKRQGNRLDITNQNQLTFLLSAILKYTLVDI